MKHFTKSMTITGLVFLLSMVLVGAASADVIRGKGWLHAEGSGVARLWMSGQVEITGHGGGTVYIYGAAEIEAGGNGRRVDLPGGGVVFYGSEGEIHAGGERMFVEIIGRKIDFTARGKGKAVLRGKGRYETEGFSGDWASDGLTIEMEEE